MNSTAEINADLVSIKLSESFSRLAMHVVHVRLMTKNFILMIDDRASLKCHSRSLSDIVLDSTHGRSERERASEGKKQMSFFSSDSHFFQS